MNLKYVKHKIILLLLVDLIRLKKNITKLKYAQIVC